MCFANRIPIALYPFALKCVSSDSKLGGIKPPFIFSTSSAVGSIPSTLKALLITCNQVLKKCEPNVFMPIASLATVVSVPYLVNPKITYFLFGIRLTMVLR